MACGCVINEGYDNQSEVPAGTMVKKADGHLYKCMGDNQWQQLTADEEKYQKKGPPKRIDTRSLGQSISDFIEKNQ
jgi:hypothetical protein